MRLVHCSDWHLGYRAYTRVTPAGINQRESDVAATFRALITRIIALAPDLVVVGGDLFDSNRPSNNTIVFAFAELARLVSALPNTITVFTAGNHDSAKTSDVGSLLPLFRQLGIHVVDRAAQRLEFPDRDLSVLCVPDAPGVTRPPLVPNAGARFNVLLLHGEISGTLPAGAAKGERPTVEIPKEEIGAERWDYVALGHYHVYHEVAPNAWYSGSIDYTSSSIWRELEAQREAGIAGKGFIEHDLATGAHTFHPLPASRVVADLGVIDCTELDADSANQAIRAAVESCPGGIDDAVARIIVHGVSPDVRGSLDHKALRRWKARALNLNIDVRRPDVVRLGSIIGPALMRGQPLEAIVAARLASRELAVGIDRDQLQARAAEYLEQAREKMAESIAILEPVTPSADARRKVS